MSVVFTTISNNFIALCADKQRIHPDDTITATATNIEKWAPHLAVGMAGDINLGEYVRSTVHKYVTENGISNFGVNEVADLVIHGYHSAVENGTVAMSETARFIVAGKMAEGGLGAIVIKLTENRADSESYKAAKVPATLILEPEDLSAAECNMLLAKALKNVEGRYLKNPLESIHRRAVRNVSEHSEFVSKESDYLLITL